MEPAAIPGVGDLVVSRILITAKLSKPVRIDQLRLTCSAGSFGGPAPTLTLTDTIVSGNRWYACDHWTGANILISGGHNLVQDDTCSPVASDRLGLNPLLGPLAGNGGPTLTHALGAGSPAIDAAGAATCPATDQRGVTRPQGAACDFGFYEAP
jgi:hypothetical protein